MKKTKIFSSLFVTSALLLMPVASLSARATISGQEPSSVQYDELINITVADAIITTDENGLKTKEIIFYYKLHDETDGFASIKVLPDGSTTTDSGFNSLITELEAWPEALSVFLELVSAFTSDLPSALGAGGYNDTINNIFTDFWDWIQGLAYA